jgi:hypothetical protein
LDVVVGEGSSVFKLLSSEDESLLIGRDSFLVLNLGLDIFNGVSGLDIKSDGLSCEGLYENLHFCLVVGVNYNLKIYTTFYTYELRLTIKF